LSNDFCVRRTGIEQSEAHPATQYGSKPGFQPWSLETGNGSKKILWL
jgi:hypothetical protein